MPPENEPVKYQTKEEIKLKLDEIDILKKEINHNKTEIIIIKKRIDKIWEKVK